MTLIQLCCLSRANLQLKREQEGECYRCTAEKPDWYVTCRLEWVLCPHILIAYSEITGWTIYACLFLPACSNSSRNPCHHGNAQSNYLQQDAKKKLAVYHTWELSHSAELCEKNIWLKTQVWKFNLWCMSSLLLHILIPHWKFLFMLPQKICL